MGLLKGYLNGGDDSPGSRPDVDHGALSPSGRVSKASKDAAVKRAAEALFPGGLKAPQGPTEGRRENLLRRARTLRDLAARGMGVRKHVKEAERLEAEAAELP